MTANCYELTLLLMGVLGCAACAGCRPAAARPLAVVLSGDTAGWIAPCGCTSNQSGGLPRRATYLGQLRRQAAVIAADVGGAARAPRPTTGSSSRRSCGAKPRWAWPPTTSAPPRPASVPSTSAPWRPQTGAPLLSANVRDRAGRLVAEPLRIVAAAGRRVALVGVLAERYATAELDVAPPRQAVLDALRAAAGPYDAAIVLAYLPEDELRQLAEALPEADAVVGGPTGQPVSPQRIGPTLLASATNEGKFVVRLDAPGPARSDRWTGSVVELDEQFADDPQQAANLGRFREALPRQDFTPEQTSFVEPLPAGLPKGFAVAGTAACRKCHEDDYRRWTASQHAEAWKSLEEKTAQVDPDCQRCHTTGYGLPGGFVSVRRSGKRLDVGCESCHGPSLGHAAEPTVQHGLFRPGQEPLHRLPRPREQPEVRLRQVLEEDRAWEEDSEHAKAISDTGGKP